MSEKMILFSCGLNEGKNLGHSRVDGYFHEMTNIPEYLKIKEIKCGRSHTLFKTINNELYAFGRNDYGQCGVDNALGEIPQITKCKIFTDQIIHFDNNNLNDNNNTTENNFEYDIFEITNSFIHEISATSYGFVFTNLAGKLFYFGNALSGGGETIKPFDSLKNLNNMNVENLQFYEIRTCNVYSGFTFKTNIGLCKSQHVGSLDQFDFNAKSDDLFPAYSACFLYKKFERKLYSYGSNSDYILGVGKGVTNISKLTEVENINDYLNRNLNMDIYKIITGCDFVIIVMKESITKDLSRMNMLLKRSINNCNTFSDIFICH
ncbi:hypothetical protein ABK040_011514 [Willaertia magna]